jgi:hypothetical protein
MPKIFSYGTLDPVSEAFHASRNSRTVIYEIVMLARPILMACLVDLDRSVDLLYESPAGEEANGA